ncbi:Thioredoxin H9 [Glycine soja]
MGTNQIHIYLETVVVDEMATFKEEQEAVLDDLETESAHLLVQGDAKVNDSDDNVDFIAGNVKLIITKEVWDQYLEEARRDSKIV